jgi:ribosomal protein S8
MLEHYYDINRKDEFDILFKDTYIGKHPTNLKNSIPVLKFNFSGIPTSDSLEEIEHSFDLKILWTIESFLMSYSKLIPNIDDIKSELAKSNSAGDLMNALVELLARNNVKYYLFIDEYDNFANNILIEHGKDTYKSITHAGGFLRSFFAVIKNGTESRVIERLFVTGVSPLVLSDVTSGFNIGDNISTDTLFNSMIGFSQEEVEELIDYYIKESAIKKDDRNEILEAMRLYYNNYTFSEATEEKLYNSDMVLYYVNKYLKSGKLPTDLLDENVRTDYGKLRYLITEKGRLNGNFNVLKELLDKGMVTGELVKSFSIGELIDTKKFKSLLFYLGLITIKENIFGNNFIFNIPNHTIKILQWDYIRKALSESFELKIDIDFLETEFVNMAFEGKWKRLFEYILDRFYEASSIRDFVFHEEGIKMFLLAYLNVSPLYIVHSEPEMNKGFADIFLQKDYIITDKTKYEYIVELKYVKKEELKKTKLSEIREQAINQLERYAKSKKIREKLIKIIIISTNDKLLLLEEIK